MSKRNQRNRICKAEKEAGRCHCWRYHCLSSHYLDPLDPPTCALDPSDHLVDCANPATSAFSEERRGNRTRGARKILLMLVCSTSKLDKFKYCETVGLLL